MYNYINTMNYNIFYLDTINLKKIKLGKEQYYDNLKLIPIYYYDNKISKSKYDSFIIKSPRLFIPNQIKKYQNFKPSLELNFINENEDHGVHLFHKLLHNIEKTIKNKLLKRSKLNLKNKQFISIMKYDEKYSSSKYSIKSLNFLCSIFPDFL